MLKFGRTLLLILIAICAPALAEAATVNLSADPNSEPDWAGDNLYRATGPCANPGAFAKVANVPKTSAGAIVQFADTVTLDGTYCYAATALDTAGNESIFSNKVEVTVNVNPPSPPANLRSVGVVP
jgi:hypothetical protein